MLQARDFEETKRSKSLVTIIIISVGLLGGLGLFFLLFQAQTDEPQVATVTLEGTAMEPTLLKNSKVRFAPQVTYQRGDIIWLNDPVAGPKQRHVRRIIAVGGDLIQGAGGLIFVNGSQLAEPYLKEQKSAGDITALTVPAGHYFVLADNRVNNIDSRQWGAIEAKIIRGGLVK